MKNGLLSSIKIIPSTQEIHDFFTAHYFTAFHEYQSYNPPTFTPSSQKIYHATLHQINIA